MLAPSRVPRTWGGSGYRPREADNNPNMPLIVDLAAKARAIDYFKTTPRCNG
jgi:hypothetical protein